MKKTLTGPFYRWKYGPNEGRVYATITLPFCEADQLMMAVRYNANTGQGQQRQVKTSHLAKLRKAIEKDEYTPASFCAGLREKHRETLDLTTDKETGRDIFILEVDEGDPLLNTDGGHRIEVLQALRKELGGELRAADKVLKKAQDEVEARPSPEAKKKAKEAEEKLNELRGLYNDLEGLPITIILHFDGDPKRDFVNLQAGLSVDSTHLFSLQVQQAMLNSPEVKTAVDLARLLHKDKNSPFYSNVRFDSAGILPLPVTTLCGRGSSDLGTSLVGLARVGRLRPETATAEWLAGVVTWCYQALLERERTLLTDFGKPLTTLCNQGKKGQATMMVGVAVCAAYRLLAENVLVPEQIFKDDFCYSARTTLADDIAGSFSSADKRAFLRDFAKEFLGGLTKHPFHEGVPLPLVQCLSASALSLQPLPRQYRLKPDQVPQLDPQGEGEERPEQKPAGKKGRAAQTTGKPKGKKRDAN